VKEASGALTTYAYDLANQLTTSQDATGMTTYTYDSAGNLHVVEQPTGQRTTTTWDDQNRQTRVLLPAGGIVTSAYRFDGLRHEKAEPQSVTKYIWDFQNYLAETDQQDDIQAIYTNEPQPYGNLISQYHKGPMIWVPTYYKFDALGSVRALTDEGGNATDTYLHDAWGNGLAVSGSTVNPFRWVGQVGYYWDERTGTFYIRARVYEPESGRWMSQDPLLYPMRNRLVGFQYGHVRGNLDLNGEIRRLLHKEDSNLYEYVHGSPTAMTDASGYDQWAQGYPGLTVYFEESQCCKAAGFKDADFRAIADASREACKKISRVIELIEHHLPVLQSHFPYPGSDDVIRTGVIISGPAARLAAFLNNLKNCADKCKNQKEIRFSCEGHKNCKTSENEPPFVTIMGYMSGEAKSPMYICTNNNPTQNLDGPSVTSSADTVVDSTTVETPVRVAQRLTWSSGITY
jgi:RHS repeat-associated protein